MDDLKQLINLLDHPIEFNIQLEKLQSKNDRTEEEEGFLELLSFYGNDFQKIKSYLAKSKIEITANSKKQKVTPIFSKLQKYAAVFIVIIGVGGFTFWMSNQNNQEITFEQTFEEPGLPNYMSSKSSSSWESSMYAYKKKEYLKAAALLKEIEPIKINNDTLIYFKGVVSYYNNDKKDAEINLKISSSSNSVFKDRSLYYLALLSLENNNVAKAITILKKLINSNDIDIKEASRSCLKLIEYKNK